MIKDRKLEKIIGIAKHAKEEAVERLVEKEILKHYIPTTKLREILECLIKLDVKIFDADRIAEELIKLIDKANKEEVGE